MNNPLKYSVRTLDPIHIGTGGYRLSSIENTIVRDPTTDIPKIPGTSLAGVIREYATISIMENDPQIQNLNKEERRHQAEVQISDYCGSEEKQGILRFHDAEILFFPVSSIQGTVWITTKELLTYWFNSEDNKNTLDIIINTKAKTLVIKGINQIKHLNLGWLLLEIDTEEKDYSLSFPPEINKFVKKLVVISEGLFSQIVNDNLEVRTSVRIDPTTGAAVEGALFTYEAIPRGTIMGFEITIDPRQNVYQDAQRLIESSFNYLRLLGIGGMLTRGFGRIDIVNLNQGIAP